jgi:hypothetical protein
MSRVVACVATFLVFASLPVQAAGPNWKLLSHESFMEPVVCFYQASDVFRAANGHVNVWTKCLSDADIDAAFFGHSLTNFSSARTADMNDDVSTARIEVLDGSAALRTIVDEELANSGTIKPIATVLLEIDCIQRMSRQLTVILALDGEVRSADAPQDWLHIPVEGETASLFHLFCSPN